MASWARFLSPDAAEGGTNGDAGLIFGHRFGENQFGAEAKRGRQTRAAVDDSDRNRAAASLAIAADIENKFGGRKVLAVDEDQIEAIGIQLLRGRGAIQRAVTGDGHLFEHGRDGGDGLIVRRQ